MSRPAPSDAEKGTLQNPQLSFSAGVLPITCIYFFN